MCICKFSFKTFIHTAHNHTRKQAPKKCQWQRARERERLRTTTVTKKTSHRVEHYLHFTLYREHITHSVAMRWQIIHLNSSSNIAWVYEASIPMNYSEWKRVCAHSKRGKRNECTVNRVFYLRFHNHNRISLDRFPPKKNEKQHSCGERVYFRTNSLKK